MPHCNDFILSFMERYRYPEIAVKEFTRLETRLDEEKDFGDRFDAILNGSIEDIGEGISNRDAGLDPIPFDTDTGNMLITADNVDLFLDAAK